MASPTPDKKSEGADDEEAEKEEIFTNSPTEAVAQQPVAQQPVDDAPKGKISTRNSRRCGTSTPKSSRSSFPYQTLIMTSAPQDPSVADTTGCTAPSDPQPITAPEPTTESVGASTEPTTSISKISTSDSGVVIDGSDAKSCPLRPGIFWKVGSRIEAKDYLDKAAMKLRPDCGPKVKGRKHMEDWYAARIVDIDYTEQTVRVHFDGWSQRFDQWVEMDSDRLRPLTRHSERKERRKKATLKTEHRVGDNVFAKWTDCRMYPALIIGIHENGSYEVLFYDGFKKTVQCINIRGMPSDVQKQYAKAGLLPEPGKKIQQKVKELMDSVQPLPEAKAAMSDSGGSSSSGSSRSTRDNDDDCELTESSRPGKRKLSLTDSAPEAKRVELDVSEEVSPAKAEHIQCPIPKDTKTKGRYTKSRKRNSSEAAVQPKETATPLVVGEGHEEESDKSTETPQTPCVKIKSENIDTSLDEGQQVEKIEVKQELVEQVECEVPPEEGPVDLKEVPTAGPEAVPCEMLDMSEQPDSLLLPTDSQPGPSQADPSSEPGNRRKSTDSVSQGPPGARAPKEFTVVDDHNKYKCPFTDCSKGFRKLSLVEYHVKYYHTEDGQKIATPINPPPRKRKKTTSICSTDSEISVGGGLNTSKVATPSLSAHLPQPSTPQVAPVVTEEEVITDAPSVQDISEVETRTSTTEEYEAETVAVDDDDDRLCTDDVVSCICQINEENGLMIQCDYCLCWQHAVCMDITEETLPKKYVCYVCCNPPGVRESMRYSCDQDWLKQGMMARFDVLLEDPTSERKAQIMQATHQLVADMHNVREVLSSTKHQLHAVKVKNTEEVKLWSRNLSLSVDSQLENNRDEHIDVGHEVIDVGHEVIDVGHEDTPPGHEDAPPPGHKDIQPTKETPSDRTLFTGDEDSKNDSTSLSSDSQMRLEPGTVAGVKDGDVETSVVMPQTEGEGLVLPDANVDTAAEFDSSGTDTASTMSMMLASEDEDRLADVAGDEGGEDDPFSRCEINLLEHILATQDEADRRFDLIEEQVALLESEDNGNRQGENILRDLPRVKKALHQLLHDLTKVKRMALYR